VSGRTTPSILHVDMDAFYASVEVLRDPSLAGKPVIVGGASDRGVVASCTYEARAYGVRSAMPSVRAKRLCPHALFLPGRFDVYAEVSEQLFAIFRSVTPLVEGISLDEAFLDVAGAERLFGAPESIAHVIRRRVSDEIGLQCSVGASAVKFIAKLASEAAKPTASRRGPVPGLGVKLVEPGDELAFLHPLPVGALWGVGPVTRKALDRFGLRTVGDLAALPESTLVQVLGNAHGRQLHALSWARDARSVVPDQRAKSIGHEETFARDLHDLEALSREAVRIGDAIAARMRRHGVAGRTVTIKVRFHDFQTITRSQTLPTAIDAGPLIARAAIDVLSNVDPSSGVRLFGVSVSNLVDRGEVQLSLDTEAGTTAGWAAASDAVAQVRARFGDTALGPAALISREGLRLKRQGDTQWGPRVVDPSEACEDGSTASDG
jgi:DNA polymerase IV